MEQAQAAVDNVIPPTPEIPSDPRRDESGQFVSKDDVLEAQVDAETHETQKWSTNLELSDDMDPAEWRQVFEARMQQHSEATSEDVKSAERERETAPEDPEEVPVDPVMQSYRKRVDDFRESHPDYDYAAAINSIKLVPEIAKGAELAILEDEYAPEIGRYLAEHPEIQDHMNEMSEVGAIKSIAVLSRDLSDKQAYLDAVTAEHLGTPIPAVVQREFLARAKSIESGLSADEKNTLDALATSKAVAITIKALNFPEALLHIAKNPHLAGRLNQLHPLAAAAELLVLRNQLEAEARAKTKSHTLPEPITPVHKSAPTDHGLSDDLPPRVWRKRFNKQMGYRED